MKVISGDFADQQVRRVIDGHESGLTARAYHARCKEHPPQQVERIRQLAVERLTGAPDTGPDRFRTDLLDAIGQAIRQVEDH